MRHCPKGHPYDEANTRYKKNGSRDCKACDRDRHRAHYKANREAILLRKHVEPPLHAEPQLCECGCGQQTSISKWTDKRYDIKRGAARRFVRGHSIKAAYARANAERREAVAPRRERVREMYEAGFTFAEMGTRLGVHPLTVNSDVMFLRERGAFDKPYRRISTKRYLSADVAGEVRRLWRRGVSGVEIRGRFGWSARQFSTVVSALRASGELSYRRDLEPLTASERRTLVKRFKKARPRGSDDELGDHQKTLLRLLQSTNEPQGVARLRELHQLLGHSVSSTTLADRLNRLRVAGLVARVRVEKPTWQARRWVWFVPLEKQQSHSLLTLADAERETELAALIGEQEEEAARGHWAKTDFKTVSLDAQFAGDGGSFHDLLAAGDEPFKAGAIER